MSSACRSATCSVDMAQPDPWLEHYGALRGGPPRARRLVAVALAALAVIVAAVAVGLARRDHSWRPPKGVAFHACTHGNRVAARCAQVRVPVDASRPEGGPSRCTSRSSRPPGSLRGERSSISRADREELRPTPRSRSTRSSPTSASTAISCSSISAGRAARTRSCVRRSTCGRPTRRRSPRTSGAASPDWAVRRGCSRARPRPTTSSASGRCSATSGSTSSAAPTAPRWRSSTLSRHPGSVRTVTLDGGSLWSIPVYELAGRNAERALRAAIARCHTPRTACLRAFPAPRPSWTSCWPRTRGAPTGSR